jgi:hypothetical protein
VRLGEPAAVVTSGGQDHFCALLEDGAIRCWSSAPGTLELGGSVATANDWPPVDLGTRPAR